MLGYTPTHLPHQEDPKVMATKPAQCFGGGGGGGCLVVLGFCCCCCLSWFVFDRMESIAHFFLKHL